MQEPLSRLRIEDLTTSNEAMARCLQLAALAAKSDVPVVLLGETGTGKTLLAHAIHNSSARAGRPFIAFNASAISDTLLESQLFGHERGAFTGAQQSVKGKFELADNGTLFLDEISEMSPLAQVKILRVLEYGEFERLGSERMLTSNARIICASNCSLRERVRQGKFREDLYQRLNGLTLLIPPLRERLQELPALIAAELKAAGLKEGKNITAIHPGSDGEVASPQVARKSSRVESYRASNDAILRWFGDSARACRFSSRSGARSERVPKRPTRFLHWPSITTTLTRTSISRLRAL